MFHPQALAFALALLQQPSSSPDSSIVATEPPPVLEPALQAAIDDFQSADSCRFEADVANAIGETAVLLGEPAARLGRFVTSQVTGGFQRGKPLFFAAGRILAFRSGETLVYRERGATEWTARGSLVDAADWTLTLLGHVPGPI